MAGRKPKPTHLKLVTGNPGKRKLNQNEPKPVAKIPDVPEHLSDDAKVEWGRVCQELFTLGLLTRLDRSMLASYCESWATWVDAVKQIKATGKVIKAPSGYPVPNPYIAIANRALDMIHKFASEFGMSPVARTRITVKNYGETEDGAEKYF